MFAATGLATALVVFLAAAGASIPATAQPSPIVVKVDPTKGHTLRGARDAVRAHLAARTGRTIFVELEPGLHHVGDGPLKLGPEDGGASAESPVVWRSSNPGNPATIAAPISVTGWKPHPAIKNALVAPLPSNITKGSTLRHFWVDGLRASRPTAYACAGPDGAVRFDSDPPGPGCNDGVSSPKHNFNFKLTANTSMYPLGSQYEVAGAGVGDPTTWPNPGDVEFVYTSCAAYACWVEPRCTVETVTGSNVALKQLAGNSTCFHRLYYFAQGWGGKKTGAAPLNPTSIENIFVPGNFTNPGTFYYDRAQATITYLPRSGETPATLEATATTATVEMLLAVNSTKNMVWQDIQFQYSTSLHASGDRGFVDTQSGYLYRDGEPPVNIHVQKSSNVKFLNCGFSHLGGVYTVGADGGSQDVIVSNSTFVDCSGGAVKLGYSGERGDPGPSPTLDPSLQDRGFLITDNLMDGIPVEYGSANPIFGGYIADSVLAHNTIRESAYSGVCLGWGWGASSFMRNVHAVNNSISNPMLRLQDGGGLYTNTPCPGCNVSNNFFSNDNVKYGNLYHDGGSGQWFDTNNVFNHVHTPVVFGHGTCRGIVVNDIWYNDSSKPNLQGAVNNDLTDENGTCVLPNFVSPAPGKSWAQWPPAAAAIVGNAGRRTGPLPDPVAPVLSPPAGPPKGATGCLRLGAFPCVAGKAAQQWFLSDGAMPGDGKLTVLRSARTTTTSNGSTLHSCMKTNYLVSHPANTCNLHNAEIDCAGGCAPVPPVTSQATGLPIPSCDLVGAWMLKSDGTVANAQGSKGNASAVTCLTKGDQHGDGPAVEARPCAGAAAPSQKWTIAAVGSAGAYTVEQNGACLDNNFIWSGKN